MTKLNKYQLHEELGRGGYGTVYRATDSVLQVERAVKVLNPALVADPEFIERFRDEARLVARLKHHHIVPVYDLGEDQGYIYLAMEYMPGGSLKDLLQKEGPLPFARATQILEQIADALDYAHAQGLVHRDIKPQNILLDSEGRAYLSDFGFAKSLASADSSTTMSLTGGILGTPAYMSPEAWDGKGWTPAADVYSLTCVFVEMLTGTPLFDGETPTRIMKQHVIEGPQFPAKWPESIPDGLAAALEKGLTQEPEARYPSAGAFLQAISLLQEADRHQQPALSNVEGSAVSGQERADSSPSTAASGTPPDIASPVSSRTGSPDTPFWQRWYLWAGIAVLAIVIAVIAWPDTPDPVVETVVVTAPQATVLADTATVAPTSTDTIAATETLAPTLTISPTTGPINYSDNFDSTELDPGWVWLDPRGDSAYSLTENPGQLRLSTVGEGHDLYTNFDAPRLIRPVRGDFAVEVQVTFTPKAGFQGAGLLVWVDENTFVRVERSTGEGINLSYMLDGEFTNPEPDYAFTGDTVYLQIQRRGDVLTAYVGESDGWVEALSIEHAFPEAMYVGMALISELTDQAIFADFDDFRISAVPETLAVATPTSEPISDPNKPPACTEIGQSWVSPIDRMTLVCVPAGEFLMGSSDYDPDAENDEKPQHTVYLDAYWIDQTEVTNTMFSAFLSEVGNQFEGGAAWLDAGSENVRLRQYGSAWDVASGYGDHPVTEVTWYGAKSYCRWRDTRLPTEAEWEKAARGTDGQTYPWGEGINCSQANYGRCIDGTSPAGSYPRGISPNGVLDMAGNVWNWIADLFDENYYANSPVENPQGPLTGIGHVVRGGTWFHYGLVVRSASRSVSLSIPTESWNNIGFRCAVSAPNASQEQP